MITAGFLVSLWQKKIVFKIIALLLFFSLTLSGFIDFFPIVNDHYLHVNDIPTDTTATWIYQNTPKDSVFITSTYLYNPASLVGRKTYLDYGYFNWSMGYDDHARRQDLPQVFSPEIELSTLCQLLTSRNLDYILTTPGGGDLRDLNLSQSQVVNHFAPSYISPEDYVVYDIAQNCHQTL